MEFFSEPRIDMLIPLTIANLKMTVRNRQALFWALAFPLIFVVVFGVFTSNQTNTITIAVVDYAQDDVSNQLIKSLGQMETFEIDERQDEEQARNEVEDGELGYVLIIPAGLAVTIAQDPPASVNLVYDDSSLSSGIIIGIVQRFLDRMNLDLAQAPNRLTLSAEGISARDLDFFDFLMPGLAVWGVMSFSVIGLATAMASYREKKILKRILATPLKIRTFLAAQMFSYLVLALVQTGIILGAGVAMFDFSIDGNILYIALLVLVGNMVFLNLGLIVGAYSKTVQAASGIGNAIVLPLMFFSGVFFPTDGLPVVLATLVEYLPLSPLLEALRGVTLEAKAFWEFPTELAILAGWIAATALVANRVFRFR